MASSKHKGGDKKYRELLKGTYKLHKEIDELETAYLLHRNIVEADKKSVQGLIRQEIGGSRWAHGGAGKLTTYKSSKDLIDKDNIDTYQQTNIQNHNNVNNNRDIQSIDTINSVGNTVNVVKSDKILDLKTKVLKKASSKIIRRDTWAAPEGGNVVNGNSLADSNKIDNKSDDRKPHAVSRRAQKLSQNKQDGSIKRENGDASCSPTYVANKAKQKQIKTQNQSLKKTASKENISTNREQSARRSRREIFNDNKKNDKQSGDSIENTEVKVKENSDSNDASDLTKEQPHALTYTPRDLQGLNGASSPQKSQRIFTTQPLEPTEIHIDPKTGQVKITSAKEELTNIDSTRVFLKPVSVHNSVESNKMTCSIVDNDGNHSNRMNGVPDIFGLDEFKTHTDDSVTLYKTMSSSPLTTAKQCNTEVEFWLRSLNIPDIDKYVRIFADNDIDLTDLEFMSASQLHDMGVTAFGALDKILKGIRDLKNQSLSYVDKPKETKTKPLTSSSIAWEEVDDNKRHKKASIANNSCQSQTFVKQSLDTFTCDPRGGQSERSQSVLSNISENLDSARLSARSLTPNPSFAASTQSSNAKCVDKKRPPSAKSTGVKPAINNLPSGKNSQSQNKTSSQSVRLKRSNSTASEKSQSRMKNFENKPNKGVLLRPRSSSLTREASRLKSDVDLSVKANNEKKEVRQLRTRSRSADVVKRKALEGVQAAAKKFEERNQKCKDVNKLFPPCDERKKLKRNEMAARHIQREKYKEINITNEVSSDTDKDEGEQTFVDDDDDQNLQSLVTVNIMSPQKKTDPVSANQMDKSVTHVVRPQVRRSSRTTRSKTGHSSVKPLNLQMDHNNEPPLLASYKIRSKDPDSRSQSEHESGYKTDNSTTYTQIEDRVRDIQLKIKRLKDKATCGDDMTLNLVHNLQKQLLHFERQLKDKESGNRSHRSETENRSHRSENGSRSHRSETENRSHRSENGSRSHRSEVGSRSHQSETESRSHQNETESRSHRSDTESSRQHVPSSKDSRISGSTPRSTLSTCRPSVTGSTPSTYDTDHSTTETSTVNTVIHKLPVTMDTYVDNTDDGVRMSKQELLDEMRKEKQQHHLQIIQLQSELQRFKQSGPVSSLELDPKDISYKIEDMIGEGVFSRVYKGEYQGSEVAVKQLKVPLQQQDKNYFAAEVSLLKELRHPRVVLLIGVCTTSKLPVMVLEYMSSGSLYDYLHNQQCESLDHALYYQIARDISSGMNYLHSHKPEVLHLDLKSMNVLLCQSLRAKIADFGFSKLRLDNGSRCGYKSKIKKTKTSIPAWMSPELLDKGEINGKTDVYSFGIILWEMLTRNFPYKGLSVFQVIEMVRKKSRPKIPEGTPEGLSHLISLCWDHNPAKRPQFKDVLQILENLAFPPAWRELFQKAGVPDTALQDVQSTRTIISLVTGTLDSGKSGILHSFMVARSNKGNNSGRNSQQSLRSSRSNGKSSNDKKKEDLLVSNIKDKMKKLSTRSSNLTSDWDCDIVSSLSDETDESEMTLKNLRSSSDESRVEYESDESSILSSDDQNIIQKCKESETTSKKTLNVVVPSLELSIQSARDELKAERRRITGEPDWLSISLDDRSQRSDIDKNSETSHRQEDSELRLTLNSSLSRRTPTPTRFASDETAVNESARSRRRNKSKDIARYSEDFWRRESYHNLRPPSPKKKTPLGKKLLDSPCRTPDVSSRLSMGEMSNKSDRVGQSLKTDSFVEKSYDSFFGHSSQEVPTKNSARHSDQYVQTNQQTEDVDFESHLIKALETEPSKDSSKSVPLGRKSISNKDEICVEDMENEVVSEMLANVSDKNGTIDMKLNTETNASISESKFVKVSSDGVDNALERVMKKIDEEAQKVEQNIKMVSENVEKALENKLKYSERNKGLTPNENNKNINHSNVTQPSFKASGSTVQDNQSIVVRNNEQINNTETNTDTHSSKSTTDEPLRSADNKATERLNADSMYQDPPLNKNQHYKDIESVNKYKDNTDHIPLNKKNEIRVVLNEMLSSKDFATRSIPNTDQVTDKQSSCHTRKSVTSSVTSSNISNDEGIRVKLNLEELSQKKKPAITPRRSIKAKSSNNFINSGSNNSGISSSKSTDLASPKVVDTASMAGENISGDNRLMKKLSDRNEICDKSIVEKSSSQATVSPRKNDQEGKRHSQQHTKPSGEDETISNSKKKTIRVKLKKDPLVPNIRREMSSPIPPAPPPPPAPIQPIVSKSVQDNLPRSSLADEIKLRVANRQSVSEAMLRSHKLNNTKHGVGISGNNMLVPRPVDNGPKLMNITELDEALVPQQSEGLPFMVQSLELRDQKDHLRSISKRHPNQLDDLSNASQEQLSSIADILKKAVMNRRLAMGEDGDSVSQSLESAATGWSIDA